ncbi:MAG: aldo/keto reductase, partial [Parvularculaceae bacterium]|nr:aldo/keto reductase [Parvularculaceae bacterium]
MTAKSPSASLDRLGFGATGVFGQRWFSESEARALIEAALDLGVRHFDTAGFYAGGEAERRLGRALAAIGAPAFVSTKTGTRYRGLSRPLKDFTDAGIRRDVEASLRRLDRETLDLLYLHGPSPSEIEAARPVLEALRAEGKILRWGVCGEGAALERAIDAGAGAVMGEFNILTQRHLPTFRRARASGVMVVAIAPLAQGLYRRGFYAPRRPADVWYLMRALVKKRSQIARARGARALLESAA